MRWPLKLLLAGFAVWGVIELRDPRRTALPFATTDLSGVQDQLARLEPEERELVEAYVRRSGGDVLPPNLADPDEPLTARSFGEAIELQRRFLADMQVQEQQRRARRAARDAALQPLRSALSLELVSRDILAAGEVQGGSTLPGAGGHPVLVTTWRLRNTSPFTIEAYKGAVSVRKRRPLPTELGVLDGCYFDTITPLAAGETLERRCAMLNRAAGPAEHAYAAMDEDAFEIDWEPRLIRYPGGQTLEFRE